MKYVVVGRGDEISNEIAERFMELAETYGMTVDQQSPDVVISIGGDGTMLEAFHQFVTRLDETSFVGIHTGHLGFFADWKPEELNTLVQMISDHMCDELRHVYYPLVEIELTTCEGIEKYLALNEFTLKGAESTLVAQLHINDENFEMFRGDGICISTPSGSTAYNKSLGGALLHPAIEAIQIAEIASINNRVFRTIGASMILPKHHHCDITPRENQNLLLTLDHLAQRRNDLLAIRSRVSQKKVKFARYRPFPFWTRVREAFIGFDVQ